MRHPKPNTEQQVLFSILKGIPPSDLEGVNTNRLFDLFQRHRLFNLAGEILPLLSDEDRQKWKQAIRTRTLKSLQQTAMLSKFVNAFEDEGIEAIPFKGPILAQILYGNIGDRHYSDLDILIRGEKIERIIQIAEKQGYTLQSPNPGLTDRQWEYYFRHKKDIYLLHREQGILLELHTRIENRVILQTSKVDVFLQELVEVRCGSTLFRSMNTHVTFIYLVMHGGIHQYFRLFWLRDVARAMESWDLDHQKVLADTRSLGIELMLGVSVELARYFFNVSIPGEYHDFLSSNKRTIEKLKRSSLKVILGPESTTLSGKFRSHFYTFRLKPGIRHYTRVVLEIFHRLYIRRFLSK